MAFNIWKKFHLGFGLPMGKSWDELPNHIMDIIEIFEQENRQLAVNNGINS